MIIWIAALILSAGGAQAESFHQVNGKSCGDLLTTKTKSLERSKTPLDYRISDLEGLFLTYVTKMQNLNETSPSRTQYFLKDMLSMKAEILNDVLSLLPYVAVSSMDEARQDKLLNSFYEIIDTMGIPGSVYGFKVDEAGRMEFAGKKRLEKSAPKAVSIANNAAIGFLAGVKPERDLPDGVHRSIGFGDQKINEENPPRRRGGSIQRSISAHKPDQLMILDGETGGIYVLPVKRATFLGGQFDGQIYRLEFNQETNEWVVTVENLNNPSGRIGF